MVQGMRCLHDSPTVWYECVLHKSPSVGMAGFAGLTNSSHLLSLNCVFLVNCDAAQTSLKHDTEILKTQKLNAYVFGKKCT